jgi:CHAT domain-containing protein
MTVIERLCKDIVSILNKANKRGDVNPDTMNELKRTGQYLYDELLTPKVKHSLKSARTDMLIVSIDDQLVQIPWELLFDGSNFLCLRFNMGRIVSTRQTVTGTLKREQKEALTMLVVADPQGNLNAAYKEGIAIRNNLSEIDDVIKTSFVGSKVDTHYIKSNIRDYEIVHYAGHSDYNQQEPSSGGWMLSDGKFSPSDIAKMSGGAPFPFLVFSNACHSGRTGEWLIREGFEENIYGLANAFLLSGVTHYIGTFWEILDSPGSFVANEFYKALVNKNISVGEALRTARKHSIEKFGGNNIIWASYMLYGDPSFCLSDLITPSDSQAIPTVGENEENRSSAKQEMGGVRSPVSQVSGQPKKGYSKALYGAIALLVIIAISLGMYWLNLPGGNKAQQAIPFDATASKTPDALQLSINIIGQREDPGGSFSEVIIREGGTLKSYDNFQVHFTANMDAYIYLLIFDSENNANLLFPDPKIQLNNKVRAGVDYTIPSSNQWFWLDENIGTETLYLLASETPLHDIQRLLENMKKAGSQKKIELSGQVKEEIRSLERGVGGITEGKATTFHLKDGKTIQNVTEVVKGVGAVVRAISFRHIDNTQSKR